MARRKEAEEKSEEVKEEQLQERTWLMRVGDMCCEADGDEPAGEGNQSGHGERREGGQPDGSARTSRCDATIDHCLLPYSFTSSINACGPTAV